MIALLFMAAAIAADSAPSAAKLDVGGNLKLFHVSSYPFDNDLFAADVADGSAFSQPFPLAEDTVQAEASMQGLLTSRFEADLSVGAWRFSVHPQLTVQPGAVDSGLQVAQTGVGIPQAVDLSWEVVDDPGAVVQLRADRVSAQVDAGPARLCVGRQAITFGHGLFFTPLDLVNPFFPTAVDQEYKPGVDAARADVFFGMGGQATVASAYRGSWDWEGLVHAGYAQYTVGLWDVGVFGAAAQGDAVGGLSLAGAVGPVSVHADASVTAPAAISGIDTDEDTFVRAVLGAQGTVTPKTSLMGEVYVQTNGATDPSDYLTQATGARYARGELWLLGRTYAGLTVAQELTPVLSGSLFVLANVEDPSALLGPGLAWSISDNTSASLGAYLGAGQRPRTYQVEDHATAEAAVAEYLRVAADPVRSELGLVPTTVFASLQAWY